MSGYLHLTLVDLLEIDARYPGLLRDVDTCIWQVELIKKQTEAANG